MVERVGAWMDGWMKRELYIILIVSLIAVFFILSVFLSAFLFMQWFKLGANISNFSLSPSSVLFHVGHAGECTENGRY